MITKEDLFKKNLEKTKKTVFLIEDLLEKQKIESLDAIRALTYLLSEKCHKSDTPYEIIRIDICVAMDYFKKIAQKEYNKKFENIKLKYKNKDLE